MINGKETLNEVPISMVMTKDVVTVTPDTKISDAAVLMDEKDIGALVVVDKEKVVGMFSERDYARKIVLKGRSSKETTVAELMAKPVTYILPWTSISECMALMTHRRIRHLPVMESEKLIGIVTIGDVVKAIISEQEAVIHELTGFVDDALKNRSQ